MTETVSAKKIRVNFFLSEGDGFLFDAVMAVAATERSSTIRRLAISGALIELMVSKGLPLMVSATGGILSNEGKDPSPTDTPSLQSSRSTERNEVPSKANKRPSITSVAKESSNPTSIGFEDVPIGVDF
jgi:hypothetical protein